MSKKTIPIVMATDKNYLLPTCVTMKSVLENGDSKNIYSFYLLVKEELIGMDEGLFETFSEQYSNFKYNYMAIDNQLFHSASLTNYHVTVETYFRLVISNLLPDYEKCIYLDGDLVVNCDVEELFEIDLKENYLAAVKDVGMQCGKGDYYTEHQKEIGFSSMRGYFNAGVLVFNLKQIREDKITDRLLYAIRRRYTIEDQDILNVICKDRIYYLPVKYNMFTAFIGSDEFKNTYNFSEEEKLYVEKNSISILHFAGGSDKPWKNLRCKKAYVWWKYAEQLPDMEWVNKEREQILEDDRQRDFSYLVGQCRKYENVILHGFTYISKALFSELEACNIHNVRFFCDNNSEKTGNIYNNIMCVPFKDIKYMINEKCLIIICAQKAYREIKVELSQLKISEENIIRYYCKNEAYYMALDERYYEYELKQIYDQLLEKMKAGKSNDMLINFSEFKRELQDVSNYGKYKNLIEKYKLNKWYIQSPLISIVIPAYNVEMYLDRCLTSIAEQDYQNWECIVVNDGSVDRTGEIAENWARKDRRFTVLSQKNLGMGPARNRAIRESKGKYITFVDSDDWVEKNYLSKMMFTLLEGGADVCKSNFIFHDMGKGLEFEADVDKEIDQYDYQTYIHPNMWCNLFDINLFRNNNIWMPDIPFEDIAIYPILLLKAKKVVGVKTPLYHYQINTGISVMDNMDNMRYYPQAIEYMLSEAKRTDLLEDHLLLFRDIACYHMFGALNSRIKNNCSREEFLHYKMEWGNFLNEKFPDVYQLYDFNRFWIWGSYNLSRIVASLPKIEPYKLAENDLPFYFGFSSIIPLMLSKGNSEIVPPHDINNKVREDALYKERSQVFKDIKPEKEDYLLVDFLEERYDLIEEKMNTWTTLNEIWVKCGLEPENYNILERRSRECKSLWEEACLKFISLIKNKFNEKNIILVENYLAPKYKFQGGGAVEWTDIAETNTILKEYYTFFKKMLPDVKVLKISEELNYTSADSQYGKDPSYYNYKAHKAMARQLKELIRNV